VSRKIALALIVLCLAFATGFALAARMVTSGGSIIPRDVVAGGGGRSVTTLGSVLNGTIGQPATAVMTATNGSTLVGGFQTMPQLYTTSARRWDLY